ncbi:hypothetical protein MW887_007144 [Aspergillus wentii]|nr:hypothetical protein MW887_007144 [Aspergillus wentii]
MSIVKALAAFCSQSQSQQYIQKVRNLGDAWRTLADSNDAKADDDTIIIETTFDMIMKIKNPTDDEGCAVEFEVPSHQSQSQPVEANQLRHYHIFPDFGTDFIWRNKSDPFYSEGAYIDSSEALASFPSAVLEHYDKWVDTYSEYFKSRCDDTGDFDAAVFPNNREEVAWTVAGYLLAWRIALADEIGSVEYSPESTTYMLEKGKETEMTVAFLKNQLRLSMQGEVII